MAQLTEFVQRPGHGTLGRAVNVRANLFPMTTLPDGYVHHYDVSISDTYPPKLNRRIVAHLIATEIAALEGIMPVYDGRKNWFTPRAFTWASKTISVSQPAVGWLVRQRVLWPFHNVPFVQVNHERRKDADPSVHN